VILSILVLLGLCAIISGFAIVTFITTVLFFKKQICFYERSKIILCFEFFLDICGWIFIVLIIMGLIQ